MKTLELQPFPPNTNPFENDVYHMGIVIGTNCTIMMSNFAKDKCNYLIIINTETGERLQVSLK